MAVIAGAPAITSAAAALQTSAAGDGSGSGVGSLVDRSAQSCVVAAFPLPLLPAVAVGTMPARASFGAA
jgi:hypothetical protein